MLLWRISNYTDLTGRGGLLADGRWHSRGRPIVYTAEHPAGALTEMLVHFRRADLPLSYQLLTIELPDDITAQPVRLEPDWRIREDATRAIGDRWLAEEDSALLRVPSAIVPEAFNVLINPVHPDSARLKIVRKSVVETDPRLV